MAAIAQLATALDGLQPEEAESVGLFPCSLQLPEFNDFREVEESSGHARHWDPGAFAPIAFVEAAAMQSDAVASGPELAARAVCHVYDRTALLGEAPESRCASMAEQRSLAAGENGG